MCGADFDASQQEVSKHLLGVGGGKVGSGCVSGWKIRTKYPHMFQEENCISARFYSSAHLQVEKNNGNCFVRLSLLKA